MTDLDKRIREAVLIDRLNNEEAYAEIAEKVAEAKAFMMKNDETLPDRVQGCETWITSRD